MTNEHLIQLGRIVVNFSSLELHLKFVTYGLISNNQQIGQTILANMSFNAILNTFGSLLVIEFKDKSIVDEFKELINSINEVNEKRNKIIHSYWMLDETNNEVSIMKQKSNGLKGIKIDKSTFSESDIKKVADEIIILTNYLMEISIKYSQK